MRIGIPKEIKTQEGRIALTPDAVKTLTDQGHEVAIQRTAGEGAGFSDEAFSQAGARIVEDAPSLYEFASLLVKVKEPIEQDLDLLREDHLLFCFLHLAAAPALMTRLSDIGLTAVGFETLEEAGYFPILAPMSGIAGRIAVQTGTCLLHKPNGGRGVLLGGLDGIDGGRVLVLGAGNAGGHAVQMAASMGSRVSVIDKKAERLEEMRAFSPLVSAMLPGETDMSELVAESDLLIGAVLVPGGKTPVLVSEAQVTQMKHGSVIIDIAVDQGGCIETIRPTSHDDPVYSRHGVLHYGVTNMPGAVPHTSTQALSMAMLPYVHKLTGADWREDSALSGAINVDAGSVVHPALQALT